LRPTHRDGRIALARALLAIGQPQRALDALAPVAGDATLASAQLLRGTALNALGRPAEALAAFHRALAVDPTNAEAELNLGNAHADLDNPMAAEHHIRRAITLDSGLAAAYASLGHVLGVLGRLPESVAACGEAIGRQPDFAAAHWNQGVAHMLAGDFAAGWEKYEWRKRHFAGSFTTRPGPQWDGGPLARKTLLVLAEQGFGDTIQFARYLPLLARRGARVVMECPDAIAPLIAALPGVSGTAPRGQHPDHDLWIDQMSLPRLFGTTAETIPYPGGYMSADPARAAIWDRLLPEGPRVGLAWAGNPLHSNDRRRSIPPHMLAPLVEIAGRALVSLQVGPAAAGMPKRFGVADRSSQLLDWGDTAAAISALDLVITVDTAVAHLAGALGVPVWVMLPHAPDWRWMLDRDDSPWYAGMRLFRQASAGDWTAVTERVAAAVSELLRPSAGYTIDMPPFTCSVAPVTQLASADAK
jgi:tetratricopeptide (TPR) repeat protein